MTQISVCQTQSKSNSVYPPPFVQGGDSASNQILKKGGGGLTGPQVLEGFAGREGVTFFRGGGVQLSHNKLKSEIFNDKKSL